MSDMHTMRLIPSYFRLMKEGKKRVEFRLLDDKRSHIRIGDEIRFICNNKSNESLNFIVADIVRSHDFSELIKIIPTNLLGVSKRTQLKDLRSIYEAELQRQYGVIAIFLREIHEHSNTTKH